MRKDSVVKNRKANYVKFLSVWGIIGVWLEATWYTMPIIYDFDGSKSINN